MQFSCKKAAKDTAATPAKEARLGGMGRVGGNVQFHAKRLQKTQRLLQQKRQGMGRVG